MRGACFLRRILKIASFYTLERFDHVDALQAAVHREIDDHGKRQSKRRADEIADKRDAPAEHDQIHLDGTDDVLVQEDADADTQHDADQG